MKFSLANDEPEFNYYPVLEHSVPRTRSRIISCAFLIIKISRLRYSSPFNFFNPFFISIIFIFFFVVFRFPSCEIFWRRSTCWTRPSGSHSTSVSPTPSYKTDSNQHPSAGPLLGLGTWRFQKISDRNVELEFVGDRNIKIRIFVDRNVKIQNFVWTGTWRFEFLGDRNMGGYEFISVVLM